MGIEYGFNSESWWSDITCFADTFLEYINKQAGDGPIVKLERKELEKTKEVYYRNLITFKNKIYGKNASENKIDRHKITALYIKSFLEILPFYVESHKKQTRTIVQNCPNEHFLMQLMFAILSAWKKKECEIHMKKNERKWFI